MNTETFVVPFSEGIEETEHPFKKRIKEFLCVIEGFKIKFKNLHWSASNKAIHTQIDDTLDIINKYEDGIAEEYQGVFANFEPNFLKAIEVMINEPKAALKALMANVKSFYFSIPEDFDYVGIKGNCESFISELNIQLYLYNLINNKSNIDL